MTRISSCAFSFCPFTEVTYISHRKSSATTEIGHVIPHKPHIAKNRFPELHFADSMGLATLNLLQLTLKDDTLREVT